MMPEEYRYPPGYGNRAFDDFLIRLINGKLPVSSIIEEAGKGKHYLLLPPYYIDHESFVDSKYKAICGVVDRWGSCDKDLCHTFGNSTFPTVSFDDSLRLAWDRNLSLTWILKTNGDPVSSVSLDKQRIIMAALRGGGPRYRLLDHFNTLTQAYLFEYYKNREESRVLEAVQ